jgi:hypothetical protein
MSRSRKPVLVRTVVVAAALVSYPLAVACSSGDSGGVAPGPSQSGHAGNAPGASGSNPGGSTGVAGGGASTQGGGTATSGAATGGVSTVGGESTGGINGGGTAGTSGGTAGSGGSMDDGLDTPPWRPLNVTAAPVEHIHGKAGMDGRAKSLGKLVVDIGVNAGGYSGFLAKRGYHSIGAPCGACAAPNLGNSRDEVGDCRLTEWATTQKSVKDQLDMLQAQYPEEDWGYFLNKDGTVRWSDVAITGISHGATTAALSGRIGARMWRIVSRSGPRDNVCGLGDGKCTAPLSNPAYDVACPDAKVASWLDQPSKTPMNRFYALVGMSDGQCGDIMFNMHRTKYIGVPVIFEDATPAMLMATNQFFSKNEGHFDFLAANGGPGIAAALNIAFGIPPENQNPAF